jgi:hypothetical protein
MTETEFLLAIDPGLREKPEVKERLRQLDDDWRVAESEETAALGVLETATNEHRDAPQEFLRTTVEPRVEATKLRFEEHKLRARLASASIVGIAATTGVLLSSRPDYLTILGISFFCLFSSAVLSLGAMKRSSEFVREALIRRSVEEPGGVLAWLTRHTFTLGLIVFSAFMLLNLAR